MGTMMLFVVFVPSDCAFTKAVVLAVRPHHLVKTLIRQNNVYTSPSQAYGLSLIRASHTC